MHYQQRVDYLEARIDRLAKEQAKLRNEREFSQAIVYQNWIDRDARTLKIVRECYQASIDRKAKG